MGHLIEVTRQHRDFIIALDIFNLRIQIPGTHLLRGCCHSPHGTGQSFSEPKPEPGRCQNQNHRKGKIQQSKVKQEPSTLRFQLIIVARGFGGLFEQSQKRPLYTACEIEVVIGVALQSDERAHLIACPIRDNHRLWTIGGYNLRLAWLFVIKQIGGRAAQPQLSQIIDDVYFFKASLKLGLKTGEQRAELAVHIHAARERLVLVH